MLLLTKVSEEPKESANINKVRENRKDMFVVNNTNTSRLHGCPTKGKRLITKGAVQRKKQTLVPTLENFLPKKKENSTG